MPVMSRDAGTYSGNHAALAVGTVFEGFPTYQDRLAQILRFVAKDVARQWILHRDGITENAELAGFARVGAQRIGGIATGINAVAGAHQHALFKRTDDPWRLFQRFRVNHQGLCQEGLDEVRFECGQGSVGQAVRTRARRHPNGFWFARGCGAQAGNPPVLSRYRVWPGKIRCGL